MTAKTYFVTGFPGFIGKRLVRHIAANAAEAKIVLLVQPKFFKEATEYAQTLNRPVEIFQGDIVDMHLGLSGEEYATLVHSVTDIFHLAAVSYLGVPLEVAQRVNVHGTRNVLELARDCTNLHRFNHFSTAYVSGDRVGVIAEDELDVGQSFRNAYEQTKFEAEKLVQGAMGRFPVTMYRPSTVVGDSKTGEIDRFDGPYYVGMWLIMSPLLAPLPLPGDGVAPLNVVPIDYVVSAVWSLANNPDAVGRTVHLVDPNPMSARRAYERIAARANKKLPRFNLSAKAADVLLRLPGLERLVRPHRAAIAYVNQLALYNCHSALELLDGTGVRCPPLSSYLDQLVEYAQAHYGRSYSLHEIEDPLDRPA